MSKAEFRFHGPLEFFLTRDRRDRPVAVTFKGRQSVKHLVESLGVPHTEIGRIQVHGREETLGRITQDGDRVEVFPAGREPPLEPRFVLDCHLGRLAAHLRMLGFDCLYENHFDDMELAEIAAREERILLTRDRRLLMRRIVLQGYCPRSLDPIEQLLEVLERFDLVPKIRPFHRCLRCNGTLEPVDKEGILNRLEPLTQKYFDEFHRCPACGGVYWKGSHYDRMRKLIEGLTKRPLQI